MSGWDALVLGMFQGLTEFLPISSSGHLVLLQKIFGITESALVFDTAVHGGTLVAVIVILRKDIWSILSNIVQPLTLYLIIATIPTVIAALIFKDQIEHAFNSGAFLGFAFLVTSAMLFISDKRYWGRNKPANMPSRLYSPPEVRTRDKMNWVDAIVIGILQAVAIIPGISRSGATISGALSRRLDREFAARFSFLLSIPTILGALVFQLKDLVKNGAAAEGTAAIGLFPIMVGSISACIIGFLSISMTLRIVREHSLWGLSLYTGVIGLFILADKFISNFYF